QHLRRDVAAPRDGLVRRAVDLVEMHVPAPRLPPKSCLHRRRGEGNAAGWPASCDCLVRLPLCDCPCATLGPWLDKCRDPRALRPFSAPTERWQSGRSHRTRNAAYGQPYRGFESLPLRHRRKGPFRTHGLRFIPEVWVTLGWRPASRGLAGISVFAGNFRPAGVEIEGSKHQPPGAHLVRELIEELCRRSMVAISRKCCD